MGLFDKLKFWKKEEADLPLPGLDAGMPNMPPPLPGEPPLGMGSSGLPGMDQQMPGTPVPPQPSPEQWVPQAAQEPRPAFTPHQPAQGHGREHELIISKLDGIRQVLDNVLLRIERMERKDQPEQQPPRRVW